MTEPEGVPILSLTHVSKTFFSGRRSRIDAVRDVTFHLYPHEIVCLVGESGSGKSTTAHLIMAMETSTSGTIRYQGQDVARLRGRSAHRQYRRAVQMIFQDPYASLNPVHTAGYTIGRPMEIHHSIASASQRNKAVLRLLRQVDLTPPAEFYYKLPYQLSGGQRQRVAIARALAVQPALIIADEPVSMLDVSLRAGILQLILQARDEAGVTFLYITHDLASARYIGDRILVMYRGIICEEGMADAVINGPQHPYTKALIEAVPNPEHLEDGGTVDDTVIPSHPSAPASPGCPYYALCPVSVAECQQNLPDWTELSGKHRVRCFHVADARHGVKT